MSDSDNSDYSDNDSNIQTSSTNTSNNKIYHMKNGVRTELAPGEVPENLKEPVLFKPDTTKKKPINFNKPRDQMVLIDDNKVEELEEAEAMLATYEEDDPFSAWENNGKKVKPVVELKLSDWELKYSEIFQNLKNKESTVVPILNFSNISEFHNISKLSTLINSIKKFNKDIAITCSGNFSFSGGFNETSFKGRHMIHMMNQLKVDFITPGSLDIENPEILARFEEFSGTIICSNLKLSGGKRISKVSSYVIRTVGKFRICFLGLTDGKDADFETKSNYNEQIDEILSNKVKDKFDFVVLLSSLDLKENKKLKNVDLILSKSQGINTLSIIRSIPIFSSDENFDSVTLSLITYSKEKVKRVKNCVISTDDIPEDRNFIIHSNYWKNLGFGELSSKYKINLIGNLNNNEWNEKNLLKKIFECINKYNQNRRLDVGYIVLSNELINNLSLSKNAEIYDIFRLFPNEEKLVKIAINDLEILEKILQDQRLLHCRLDPSNIMITTKSIAENILSEYVLEISAVILDDVKIALIEFS